MEILEGKVAIITGSSRGIGKGIALELSSYGAKVVINYNDNKEIALETEREIKNAGGNVLLIKADVSILDQAKKLVHQTIEEYGKIDFLINNAGITRDKTFRKMVEDEWRNVIDVNLISVFNMSNSVLPFMINNNFGRIINISSVIGQTGAFGQTNYSASKAGVIGFTKSLALETAKNNITVNAICPGYVETEMVESMPSEILEKIISKIPLRRLGEVHEIAKAVAFLLSDGGYITGQQININGGLHM
jgi:acetoacetyl-CoA reductase